MTYWARVAVLAAMPVAPLLADAADMSALQAQVMDAERSFARSMAARDLDAFAVHVSDQALFFGPKQQLLRGKTAVVAGWRAYFSEATAPFSWAPDQVEVLDDGQLALSTGPVRDPQGNVIGRFNSVWRQESPGQWRVVLDKGQPAN